jgi:hypothetical protein
VQVLGQEQQRQRRGTGLALVAVDEQGQLPIHIRGRRKVPKVPERLDPEQRRRRVDEIQVEVVEVLERQIVPVVVGQRHPIAHRRLMAGRFAGVDHGEAVVSWRTGRLVADVEAGVELDHRESPAGGCTA